jgi:N-formylglutamate deformylase
VHEGTSDRYPPAASRTWTATLRATTPEIGPVVVHVPHAGRSWPLEARRSLVVDDAAVAREELALVDHRTDELAADVRALGATLVVAEASRLVLDPERYLDPDEEEMERVGMGAVYTHGAWGDRLRHEDPALRAVLLDHVYRPHHAAVSAAVAAALDRHGRCTVVDVHSYPTEPLPYELHGDGARPPLCIGTDRTHTPPALRDLVAAVAIEAGLEVDLDTPFAGTFVPSGHLGDPRVASVMLELRRDTYLDEATATCHDGAAGVRAIVTEVVRRLVATPPAPR